MGSVLSCINQELQIASKVTATEDLEQSATSVESEKSMGSSNDMSHKKQAHWARGPIFAKTMSTRQAKSLQRTKKPNSDTRIVGDAVKQNTLLGAILAPQLQEMIEYMIEITVIAGQCVDLSGGMCIILDGKVEIKSGGNKAPVTFSKGQVVGDVGLLHGKVEATCRTQKRSIPLESTC